MQCEVVVTIEAKNNDTFAKIHEDLLAHAAFSAIVEALKKSENRRGYLEHDADDAIAVKIIGTSFRKI